MECKSIDDFTTPTRKLLQFFIGSRDNWKSKYQSLKARLKLLENQNRAVEKSRRQWRERALETDRKLRAVRDEQKKNDGC